MTNSGTDTNVVTKFQPMPKRFMVWDAKDHSFKKGPNGCIQTWREIANLVEPSAWDCACEMDEIVERFTIIQSTNLFDKDGKEIFEGSIVQGQVFDDSKTRIVGVVVYRQQTFWIVNAEETHSEPLLKFYEKEVKVIGHILSNPELLEERNNV